MTSSVGKNESKGQTGTGGPAIVIALHVGRQIDLHLLISLKKSTELSAEQDSRSARVAEIYDGGEGDFRH